MPRTWLRAAGQHVEQFGRRRSGSRPAGRIPGRRSNGSPAGSRRCRPESPAVPPSAKTAKAMAEAILPPAARPSHRSARCSRCGPGQGQPVPSKPAGAASELSVNVSVKRRLSATIGPCRIIEPVPVCGEDQRASSRKSRRRPTDPQPRQERGIRRAGRDEQIRPRRRRIPADHGVLRAPRSKCLQCA